MITNNIHGHEVLNLIDGAEVPFTRKTLVEHVLHVWGADARFRTCSCSGVGIDELVDFLMSLGKIVVSDQGTLSIDRGEMCGSASVAEATTLPA